jgi:hypothetical protein
MRAAEEISWIFWRLNLATGELKQLTFMTCPWSVSGPDDAVAGIDAFTKSRSVPSRRSLQPLPQTLGLIRSWYANERSIAEPSDMEVTNIEGLGCDFSRSLCAHLPASLAGWVLGVFICRRRRTAAELSRSQPESGELWENA